MSDLLSQASLVLIPSGYKEDVVYSVVPSDGSGDLSFTRASNGTRVNSAGLVEDVAWNIITYSEDLTNAAWAQDSNIVTSNSIIAPNGTTTGETISNSATTALFRTYQYITGYGQPQTLTFSTYFKYKDHRYISFGLTDDSDYRSQVVIDLQNMVITQNYKSNSGDVLTSTIESVGNGWYKVVGTLTYNTALAGGNLYLLYKFQTSGTFSSLGTFQTGTGFYIWGAQLNIGATAKPYFPTTDRLNVPRLTYQNGGGGCPSLLLEPQRTNLVTFSEQFDNASWAKGNSGTITANSTISPDGTQTADTLNAGADLAQVQQAPIGTSGAVYTVSIWVKRITGTGNVFLRAVENADTLIAVTSDWQRFTATVTSTSTSIRIGVRLATSGDAVAIWGAQIELGAYPTTYIPTTSSSATRVADECFKTGISSLIGQTEGTLFVEVNVTNWDTPNRVLGISDGTSNNRVVIIIGTSQRFRVLATVGGAAQVDMSSLSLTNGIHKVAIAYKENDFAFYVDGVQAGTDTSALVPTCTDVYVGKVETASAAQFLGNGINQTALFPTRLTNAELASLTTI